MVNDKVGPSQFRKLRFSSKDDNPQKLDNRVKELFKGSFVTVYDKLSSKVNADDNQFNCYTDQGCVHAI